MRHDLRGTRQLQRAPALLPLLVAVALPSAWGASTMARHRYVSWHRFVQQARAARLWPGSTGSAARPVLPVLPAQQGPVTAADD
ncbi:hypothetical protein [Streptomyces sp. NPDC056069]|uniref:hypothetical protein n=1 Tax=Streptomyces sp. NPDC056069 TaxID=3345702 RepID=UPI0035DCD313